MPPPFPFFWVLADLADYVYQLMDIIWRGGEGVGEFLRRARRGRLIRCGEGVRGIVRCLVAACTHESDTSIESVYPRSRMMCRTRVCTRRRDTGRSVAPLHGGVIDDASDLYAAADRMDRRRWRRMRGDKSSLFLFHRSTRPSRSVAAYWLTAWSNAPPFTALDRPPPSGPA